MNICSNETALQFYEAILHEIHLENILIDLKDHLKEFYFY